MTLVTDMERTPPHNLEAEGAVLSTQLVDAVAVDQVGDILRPEHFYSEAHRRIQEAIAALAERGTTPDIVQVATWLRDNERLAQVGGTAYLTEVLNAAPNIANARKYAESVRDAWLARETLRILQRFLSLGYGGYAAQYESARGYVNAIAEAIYELECADVRTQVQPIGEILKENWRKVQEAQKAGKTITGEPTGFDRYDRITAGLHGAEMTIVAARPGMGKTSLALNWATNVAASGGGAIVFSLEMPREQLVNRMMCSEARVDSAKVRTGMLAPTDWSKLTNASQKLHTLPIWIDDQAGITLGELRSKVRRTIAQAQAKGQRMAMVVVDYLQLMGVTPGIDNREQQISALSRGLKQLALELRLPFVVLAQLNRQTEAGKDKRPQLSNLRESGAIEQDADNVCFIYRDDYYDKETADRNVAELIIAKQRNGPTDTVKVWFDSQFTRFDNLADGEFEGDGDGRFPG